MLLPNRSGFLGFIEFVRFIGLSLMNTINPKNPINPTNPVPSSYASTHVPKTVRVGTMHVRLSTCLGTEVVDRSSGDRVGAICGLFVHPDTGKIEGMYVSAAPVLFGKASALFCGSDDIVHWGASVQIRSHECLSPFEDRIRLLPLLQERRTIVGQRIRSETGRLMGVCRDIQVDTEKMRLEWIFPRRFFREGIAVPASDIVEVRSEAIIVRDSLKKELILVEDPKNSVTVFESFPEIAEARGSTGQ